MIRDGTHANAYWQVRRCHSCDTFTAVLVAASAIAQGEEVTVSEEYHVLGEYYPPPPLEVTFDGGARDVGGIRVAGASAILWGPEDGQGDRSRLRTAFVALPAEQYAQVAEAWGLRLGCQLLDKYDSHSLPCRSACVIGDNLPVVRYAASQGRLHRPHMQALLEHPLARLALSAWNLSWMAVRRRFNAAADEAATKALLAAAPLAKANQWSPMIWYE